MAKLIGVNDAGQIVGQALAALQGVIHTEVGPQVELADAINKSKAAKASEAAYEQAVVDAEMARRGQTVMSFDMEDTAKLTPSYGSWIKTDAPLAHGGSKYYVLPVANTNTATGKPVHGYVNIDVPVTSGTKYALRAWMRSAGDVTGAQIAFLIAKSVSNAAQYWATTPYVGLEAKGVTATSGWVEVEVQWTATETTTARIGVSARNLVTNLYVDDVQVSDLTNAADQTATVTAAKATWDADLDAARAAWGVVMPDGVVSSGGSNVVTLSRAEYDALAVKDPDVTYLVTV